MNLDAVNEELIYLIAQTYSQFFGDELVDIWIEAMKEPNFKNLEKLERHLSHYCWFLSQHNDIKDLLYNSLDDTNPGMFRWCCIYGAYLQVAKIAPRVKVEAKPMGDAHVLNVRFLPGDGM